LVFSLQICAPKQLFYLKKAVLSLSFNEKRKGPLTKATILVVGGAGYIGSLVNRELHQAGYQTVVYDNLSRGTKEAVHVGTFILGDMGDEKRLAEAFEGHSIDAVINFAAHIDVEESVRNPAKYYANNVAKTLVLLDAMRKHGVNRFVFSSSAAIFGLPKEIPVSENHPCTPINPYGASKLMVENILRDYDKAFGLHYCTLRYFNVAGFGQKMTMQDAKRKETNLIPVILKNLRNSNFPTTIFGTDYPTRDGTCVRDYIHVVDLADAHIKSLGQLLEGEASKAYNLGNGTGYTVKEVIEAVRKVTGQPLNIIEGKRRPGDPHALIANGQQAAKELNWYPKHSLEDMVTDYWNALTS